MNVKYGINFTKQEKKKKFNKIFFTKTRVCINVDIGRETRFFAFDPNCLDRLGFVIRETNIEFIFKYKLPAYEQTRIFAIKINEEDNFDKEIFKKDFENFLNSANTFQLNLDYVEPPERSCKYCNSKEYTIIKIQEGWFLRCSNCQEDEEIEEWKYEKVEVTK